MPFVLGEDGSTEIQSSPIVAMREVVSLLTRQNEDLAWNNVSADPARLDLPYDQRVRQIERARAQARKSPLAKTAIGLLQHYVLGQGVSVKAQNKTIVARVVDEFMNDPRNKKILTSHDGQKEFLSAIFTDGSFFIVLFPDKEAGTLQLGTIDALYVEDAIPDPGNAKIIKWYKVKRPNTQFNFARGEWETALGQEFVYYRHWENDDPVPTGMGGKLQPGLVMQIDVDKAGGKFGQSQLATAGVWLEAHRQFMENRATINAAAAAVAWRKKRLGSPTDVAAEAQRMQSSLVNNANRFDSNPTRAAGATVVENAGSHMEWVDTNTGGAAADYDERKLRMMAGSGMGGIPNHYFGDEAAANLATATAMELPLLKMYEEWQAMLGATLQQLIEFALSVAHEAGRIGERDDSSKYAERVTTPQGVMDQPDQEDAGAAASKPTPGPTQPGVTVKTVITREALPIPFTPAPAPGLRLIPRPDETMEDPEPITASDPVSWYVDIDFPPIIQKQIDLWLNALKILLDMLPGENIESRKLVAELALTAFGVNDIDQTMERIFPADMVAVMLPAPPPPPPGFGQPPPQPGPVQEAITTLAELRARRIQRAADDTVAAIVGG